MVEVPKEPVFIVIDRGHKGHHQPPRSPHLDFVQTPIRMLPEHAIVFFVEANRVFNDRDIAATVGEGGIEVMDFAHAVAAQLEGVRQ